MSALPFAPPPLPQGWTEHLGPAGQIYYYNAQTQESTYIRPLPPFLNLSHAPVLPVAQPKPKKEKPLVKTPIPGTEWMRVKTTEGNVFYTHKAKKASVWTVPEEIQEAVELLEQEEEQQAVKAEEDSKIAREGAAKRLEDEQLQEVERIRAEVQDMVKRKAEDDPVPTAAVTKKQKIEKEEDSDESEEEDWQREAAAQLALEAEIEAERRKKEEEEQKASEEAEVKRLKEMQINMPARVDLSIEEAKALFKTLLREKDINPLHPWDKCLPQFVSDPRYVLLPSVSARREAFDEYCRDRARELRQLNVKQEKDPKDEFVRLLTAEVKSTRTSWSDFRRTWKKDRRFYGWGRDDREREKRFREYLKELGEKKRAAAQKAEADFFALLKESITAKDGLVWKETKGSISKDPRYDAVGSSSLREELFNTFLKATTDTGSKPRDSAANTTKDESTDIIDPKERKERAVKERAEKVRVDRERLEASIGRSRNDLTKNEGERDFKTLLTDAVREPQSTWEEVLPQLKTDPRFTNSPLPINQQIHLFHTHVGHLRSKHANNLHALFESHAPSLATKFSDIPLESLLSSLPVTKLGLNEDALEHEFERWQRERTSQARIAFDEMLAENSFVEFWGRLGKIGGEGVDGGVKADEADGEEGEGGGGKVDMKALAKSVDVHEIETVLKNDKRYIMFDHVPEQRERWIRDYVGQLTAPKLSVHLPTA